MGGTNHGKTYKTYVSAALEPSGVISAATCQLAKISGRIDSTAASATYYLQLIKSPTVPVDGAVTFLIMPVKLVHTTGEDTEFDIDLEPGLLSSSGGAVYCISSTEFTKTIVGSNVAALTALFYAV